nr:hypothetical protein [Clostridia bacterium]
MKKIGFIDYYLNNWHSDNYPALIEKYSGGEMKVTCAYGCPDAPITGGKISNEAWAEKYGIELCATIDEVIEKSDFLVVLSPNNPEQHLRLCEKPLMSGKLTYIDKTFAPDRETALKIFEIADKHNTPCYSSSALHFADEYRALHSRKDEIETMRLMSPNTFEIYSIHMIEPIACLMNEPAKRVMCVGKEPFPSIIVEFESGRTAQFSNYLGATPMFASIGFKNNTSLHTNIESPYFDNFIKGMVEFFNTGIAPVEHRQTVEVITIRTAAVKALEKPFEWINL